MLSLTTSLTTWAPSRGRAGAAPGRWQQTPAACTRAAGPAGPGGTTASGSLRVSRVQVPNLDSDSEPQARLRPGPGRDSAQRVGLTRHASDSGSESRVRRRAAAACKVAGGRGPGRCFKLNMIFNPAEV